MGNNKNSRYVSAADTGAPHIRERIWIRATNSYSCCIGCDNGSDNWEERQILYNENRDATKDKPEWSGWRCRTCETCSNVADTNSAQRKGNCVQIGREQNGCSSIQGVNRKWWAKDPGDEIESGVGRMAYGLAFGVDRLKAIGNGQVPMAAALAWELLK